ncbi:GAF domain-containing protein [Methylobacterium sp. J-059]|jgi:hypothetical protein|uniref:GAF domain-containing protein n=1 Tax=Methylobacterium sp. J-059 TaxID=2836643 RepID=UPI001FBA14E4|nr:GAF domain-containing protein [Methylobacterium sp. J-059]MCJ2038850.1 GAF domain-containing protein [Methylobacterium sp. J-059]
MAGRALALSRAAYGIVDPSAGAIVFERDWTRPGQRSVVGRHRFANYGTYAEDLSRGETVVIPDVRADSRTASKAMELGLYGIASLLDVPAMAEGRLVGVLCLHDADPRDWTERDIVFARAAAERGRAELARIAAEEQQQLWTREVSHRFKNLLAKVQAIATQTMRSTDDFKVASDILAGRLAAKHAVQVEISDPDGCRSESQHCQNEEVASATLAAAIMGARPLHGVRGDELVSRHDAPRGRVDAAKAQDGLAAQLAGAFRGDVINFCHDVRSAIPSAKPCRLLHPEGMRDPTTRGELRAGNLTR